MLVEAKTLPVPYITLAFLATACAFCTVGLGLREIGTFGPTLWGWGEIVLGAMMVAVVAVAVP